MSKKLVTQVTETVEVEVDPLAEHDGRIVELIDLIGQRNKDGFEKDLAAVVEIMGYCDGVNQVEIAERYEVAQSEVSRWKAAADIMSNQPKAKDWYMAEPKKMRSVSGFVSYYNTLDDVNPVVKTKALLVAKPQRVTDKVIEGLKAEITAKLTKLGYSEADIAKVVA